MVQLEKNEIQMIAYAEFAGQAMQTVQSENKITRN